MILSKQIKVVYAEDQLGVRKSVCEFLNEHENMEVVFDTDDGKQLINYLRRTIPVPSICILDITMPEMDGITLLKKIRKTWPKLPCLIYSMHRSTTTIAKAIYMGANGYLSKQHDYDALYQAVTDIITNGIAYTKDAGEDLFKKVRNNEIEVPVLTERERSFLELVATECTYQEIAQRMGVAYTTVKGYRETCFKKLNVNSRATLVLKSVRLGIINI